MKNEKYTWNDLYTRADGAACGEDTLKAKDNARWQVREFVIDQEDKDLEEAECPEDEVDWYCDKYNILFYKEGYIIEAGGLN